MLSKTFDYVCNFTYNLLGATTFFLLSIMTKYNGKPFPNWYCCKSIIMVL